MLQPRHKTCVGSNIRRYAQYKYLWGVNIFMTSAPEVGE